MSIQRELDEEINDIISKIENERYIKAKSWGGSTEFILIDLDMIKNHSRLEGADIMRKLFGVFKDTDMFCYKLNYVDEFATILKDFHITSDTWYQLVRFIRTGKISESACNMRFLIENDKRTSCLARVKSQLEELMQVSIKFGGIPSVDEYYENFYKKLNNNYYIEKYGEYNPGKPTEDKLNRYMWACHNAGSQIYSDFINNHKVSDGWSAAASMSTNFVWYRKLKKGNESDIDAVYTLSEIESEEIESEESAMEDPEPAPEEHPLGVNNYLLQNPPEPYYTGEGLEYDFDSNEDINVPYSSSWLN